MNEYEFLTKNFEKINEQNKKEIEKLNKTIIQLTDNYNKTIDDLKSDYLKIQKENFEKDQLITIKNEEIIHFKNKYEAVEKNIENYRKQILKMKNEYFFLKQILNDKENEIKALYDLKRKYNYTDLIEENPNKNFDDNNLDNLKEQYSLLNKKYKRLKDEKDTIVNNNEYLKDKLKNFDDIKTELLQLKERKINFDENNKIIELLKKENEELKQSNNQYKETFKILNQQNKTLLFNKTLQDYDSSFLSFSLSEQQYKDYIYKTIDELSNRINDLIQNNLKLQNNEKNFLNEKNELKKEIGEYKITLEQMQNYISELEEINKEHNKKNLISNSSYENFFNDKTFQKQNILDENNPNLKKLLQQNKVEMKKCLIMKKLKIKDIVITFPASLIIYKDKKQLMLEELQD